MKRLTAESLRGIWAAVPVSWCKDYTLDEESFRSNIRRLCTANVHGVYTTGSTGEFYALDWPEFRQLVDIMAEEMSGCAIAFQIGCNGDDTRDMLRQMEYAAERGAAGVQFVLPYWMVLTDQEVTHFFGEIAAAFPELPLVHYNNPGAKRFLIGEDYRRLLDVAPNLIGVKFSAAGSHFGELQDAVQITPSLSYFVVEDLLVSAMQLGARGSYSSVVLANPRFMLEMFAAAEAGKWAEALKMQLYLARFRRELEGAVTSLGLGGIDPVYDKGFAVASGFLGGHQRTRPPYIGWTDDGLAQVRAWLMHNYPDFIAE